ncbi:hypothetical protein PZA11_001265 [Diplocarpon coronariae]
MINSRRTFRPSDFRFESKACLTCRRRTLSIAHRRLAEKSAPSASSTPVPEDPLADAPRSYGKAVSEFTPKSLSRPIGLPNAPRAGENIGVDTRSTQKISTPYFREWSNMRLHKGKSFLAPPRLFKAERALYFPNIHGQTLRKEQVFRDTTPVLKDKVSVVSVFSSTWAENQTATFVAKQNNPEIHEIVASSGGMAQIVQINIEENALKAMLVKFFMPSLRKRISPGNWGRYFLVQKGLSDQIKDAIGLLNSKVGYVYLLDGECRIRWAGSGPSEGDEKDGLVRGAKRLINELRTNGAKPAPAQRPEDTTKPLEIAPNAA